MGLRSPWFWTGILLLLPTAGYSARMESAVGIGYGMYQGPSESYITPEHAPGINFSTIWIRRKIHWVSKVEISPLVGGKEFGASSSPFAGLGLVYKFQPKMFIVPRDSFQPYLTAGPVLGLFALFLTNLSVGQDVSNNQASVKYGFTAGIGSDWIRGEERGTSGNWNVNLEYFYFLPSIGAFQFQGGRVEARGLHLSVSWSLSPDDSK